MPKQELDAEQLYNLALSIVGLVLNDGPATVTELAEHFAVSEKAIAKAVTTISNSEDVSQCKTHFYLNYEAFEEGEVDFGLGEGNLEEAPVISASQASALAMGLDFLSSLPEFKGNSDLVELRRSFSNSTVSAEASIWNVELDRLELIRNSIVDQKRISFSYLNQTGKRSDREVDPLRIDLIGAKHYLRGYCLTNSEVRSFRLDRISQLEATEMPISEQARVSAVSDEIYGSGQGQLIELEVDKSAEEIFWNFPALEVRSNAGGSLHGSIRVGNIDSLARHVVRYGGSVRVLAPESARMSVARFASTALHQTELEVE